MTRRPRPASRQAKGPQQQSRRIPPRSNAAVRDTEEPLSDSSGSYNRGEVSGSVQYADSVSEANEEGEDADVDVDAPRVVLWQDEDDIEGGEGESGDGEENVEEGLHSLPLGALVKAQRSLASPAARSNSDDSDRDSSADEDGNNKSPRLLDSFAGRERQHRKDIAKRANKHAPQEATSKRPVSRRRQVAEVQKIIKEARDPRFLPMTGAFDASKFRNQYSFLSDIHKDELITLRENLKRARKLLASSPRDLRAEREREVERLERAYKRVESAVSRDKHERIEQEALDRVTMEEKQKRKDGKGAFYLKNSEKKKLLLKARYDATAAEGGKKAVKKAMQKKQKKLSQKETKSRPFARGVGPAGGADSRKRARESLDRGHASSKRRKFD